MYVYCVYPAMLKSPKTTAKLSKKSRTSVVLTVFDGVLCEVRAYTVTVSYRCSTCNRYMKSYILVSDRIYGISAIYLLK